MFIKFHFRIFQFFSTSRSSLWRCSWNGKISCQCNEYEIFVPYDFNSLLWYGGWFTALWFLLPMYLNQSVLMSGMDSYVLRY